MTSKGQITIPARIRQKLGLTAGSVLDFDEQASYLKATKAVDLERMRSVIGMLKRPLSGKTTLEWLEELRGPADLPPKPR